MNTESPNVVEDKDEYKKRNYQQISNNPLPLQSKNQDNDNIKNSDNNLNNLRSQLPIHDQENLDPEEYKKPEIMENNDNKKIKEKTIDHTRIVYGSCSYKTFRIFEYIVYPFICFISTLLIEILIGIFYIVLGFTCLFIMTGIFIFLFIVNISYIMCKTNDDSSKENLKKRCELSKEWLFWSFKNGGWGLILVLYSIIDGIIGIVQTIRAVNIGEINVYKSAHENIIQMWNFCCLFAKEHNLLSLKLVGDNKNEIQNNNNYNV